MSDIRDALLLGRNSEGRVVHRPLSPHLQIYCWPVTMAASILNRASGIAVSVGTLLLVWWLAATASSSSAYETVQSFLGSPIGLLLLFGWTGALFLHLALGVRHLLWDAGIGFEHATLNRLTYLTFALAACATLIVWIAGLIIWWS